MRRDGVANDTQGAGEHFADARFLFIYFIFFSNPRFVLVRAARDVSCSEMIQDGG